MEDGGVDHFGDVGAVGAGPGAIGRGCETDLVVDDDVDGAADVVVFQALHLECLHDNTLSSKRGITVDLDRDYLLPVFVFPTKEVLLGADTS